LPSQRIVQIHDASRTAGTGDRELARQAQMRACAGRYHLEHDPGLPGRLDQPLDLVPHHGRAAHRPGQDAG
jgi:hypothetical protein